MQHHVRGEKPLNSMVLLKKARLDIPLVFPLPLRHPSPVGDQHLYGHVIQPWKIHRRLSPRYSVVVW